MSDPTAHDDDTLSWFRYTADQWAKIAATVPAESDMRRLRGDAERAAQWYRSLNSAGPDPPPSVFARKFGTMARRARQLNDELGKLPIRLLAELEYAADRHARETGSLPDEQPQVLRDSWPASATEEEITITHWPVDKQLARAMRNLDWICAVLSVAQETSEKAISTSGPRKDEPTWLLYTLLESAYRAALGLTDKQPLPRPYIDNYDDGQSYRNDAFLSFVEACVEPVGIVGQSKIWSTLRRAVYGDK